MSLGNQGVFLDIKSGKLGSETKGTTAKIKEILAMTAILALMLTILFLGPNAARLALLQLFGGALVVIGLLYLLAFAPALFGLIAVISLVYTLMDRAAH